LFQNEPRPSLSQNSYNDARTTEQKEGRGEDTIKYDGPNSSGFGLLDSGTFYAAVRFHPQQSCTLKAITFYQNQPTVSGCWIYLYEEGQPTYPGQKIDSIFYMGMPGPGGWVRLNFTTSHFRAGGVDFWLSIKITQNAGQTPLGIDSGPSIIPSHSFVSANGSYWRSLPSVGRNNNFNIRAIVRYIQPGFDIGIDEILIYPYNLPDTAINLKARIKNYSASISTNIPVVCSILGVGGVLRYTNTLIIASLAPCDTVHFSFGTWTPTIYEELTIIMRLIVNDEIPANDREVLILGSSGYYEDFELGNGDYNSIPSTGGWEWGIPFSGPYHAVSGTKLWATVLNGSYSNNANWTLTTPEFIATGTFPQLKFWHWYSFEGSSTLYDGGNVKISTNDGQTWSVITPIGGYTGTAYSSTPGVGGQPIFGSSNFNWTEVTFNLPVNTGQRFKLRWHFGSDGSICDYPGWYIDDITGIGFMQSPPIPPPPPVANDVGVQVILSPGAYHFQNTPMIPVVRIKNYGALSQTNVPVVCSIIGPNSVLRYTNTQTVNIGAGETLRVNFSPWIPTTNENCNTIFRTCLVNDEVPSNDRATRITKIIGIGSYINIGESIENARVEPLDRYYNYNTHEVIYLNSEIGISGTISKIGYYKHSGNNVDPILPVTIYMKQTTDDYMLSGSYSLTGYTQVYYGEFPNNATSGWMDVQLTTPFNYNNTSSLSILILKGYQQYISTGYPYWRYTLTPRYLTRGKRDDSIQPSSLVVTYNRPNIRLLLTPVGVQELNNPNSMPMITALYAPKPNPTTNNKAHLSFSLAEPSKVSLKIYDIQGRKVKTLVDELMSSCVKNIVWNCRDDYNRKVAEGVYFVTLETTKQKFTKKLILTR
jgi:hypothetical protein